MNLYLIHGDSNRVTNSDVIFRSGNFAYKLDVEWAKWPEHLKGVHINDGSCDNNGNLFVGTNDKEYPIIMLNKQGEIIRTFGKGLFVYTHGVLVTPWDTLLCADSSKIAHVVREITFSGELVRDFGKFSKPSKTGYNPDEFIIAKHEGRIPVDEPWEDKREFYLMLDTIKYTGGPCNRPTNSAIGPSGEKYISDGYGNCAVHKFNMDGNHLITWGSPGREPGQFRCPHGIWVDKYNRVVVCDRENQRVQVFTVDGELIAIIDNLMTTGSVWGNGENIFIGEFGGITILDLELNVVGQLGFNGMHLRCHGLCGNLQSDLFIMSQGKLYKMVRIND